MKKLNKRLRTTRNTVESMRCMCHMVDCPSCPCYTMADYAVYIHGTKGQLENLAELKPYANW